MVLTWSAMKIAVYIIFMQTLVSNLIFIAKIRYSSVDQHSPVGCGAGIATDSNELHDLFKRQCSLIVSVRSMCTLQTIMQPCATRRIHILAPYNGHKNC